MAATQSLSAPAFDNPLRLKTQATPANPPSGSLALYFKADGLLYSKSSAGVESAVGGGGGTPAGVELDLTQDWTDTMPTPPPTGVTLFARHRARRLLTMIGPTGLDTALQPAFFTNRIARMNAVNGSATPTLDGLAAPTFYSAAAVAAGNTAGAFYNGMVKFRYTTPGTANNFNGFRTPTAQWFLSSTANLGGFFWVLRFGIFQHTATGRGWVGLNTLTANDTNADPSTLLNRIGFGHNSTGTGSTNWYFHSAGGSANATITDLGSNFPARTSGTNFFEFRLFSPSGAGSSVYWSAQRLNDGFMVQGGPVTTNLPALNTLLNTHAWVNNVTAAASSIDIQSLYVETDN